MSVFNGKHIDKYLIDALFPVFSINSSFSFYNINEMKKEYLEVLKEALDEYTFIYDPHQQHEKVQIFVLFPSERTTKQKYKFKDILFVIKLLNHFIGLFILNQNLIKINNAILDDVEVLELAHKQLSGFIIFENCQIVLTDKSIEGVYFSQNGTFQNCHFEAKTQTDGWLEFGNKVSNRAYGRFSLRYFEKHDEVEYSRCLLDAMNIMDRNRKLGLTKIK